MAVIADWALTLKVQDSVDLALALADDPTVTFKPTFTNSGQLTGATAVPATKQFTKTITLAAGVASIDLTALVAEATKDFTGLKVQLVGIFAASTNTATVICKPGAANPARIFGTDAGANHGQVVLDAGCGCAFYMNDKLVDVGATAKNVDFSSTDVDAVIEVLLVAG